jgi:hypothetical protein
MKHNSHKTIQILNSLRSIKPNDGFKIALRGKIFSELGPNFVLNRSNLRLAPQFTINSLFHKRVLTPLFLMVAMIAGSAGTTYAAQSSLPGETLYPIKIASEKTRIAIATNNAGKARLHGKFAERRLAEIDSLANNPKVDSELVKIAVENYKAELAENRTLIENSSTGQTPEITKIVAENIHNDREILHRLSTKITEKRSKDYLLTAWERATAHEDFVTLSLLNSSAATSTLPVQTTGDSNFSYDTQMRVINKIAEAAHKITETERYMTASAINGGDIAQAKAQIILAKDALVTAQSLAEAGNFQRSFIKASEAAAIAQLAKKMAEKNKNGNDEHNFYIAPYLNEPGITPTTTINTPQTTVLPINWDNYKEIRKEWRAEVKKEMPEQKRTERRMNNR